MPLTEAHDYRPYEPILNGLPRLPQKEGEVVLVVARVNPIAQLHFSLSEEEEKKCSRLVREQDRMSYRLRHGLLRLWLSEWTGMASEKLVITQNAFGKPEAPATKVHFNMSRSGDLCAFAFAGSALGVDIEVRRDSKPFLNIADSHYHPDEKAAISSDDAFFRIWTRKEAVMKAEGSGLSDALQAMNCSNDDVWYKNQRYHVQTRMGQDFVLSLACRKPPEAVLQFLLETL